jgi:hypothetical protein
MLSAGGLDFTTCPPYLVTWVGGPGLPHARGLLVADKHHLFWVLGSVSLKHRPRWDVVVGTHAHLAVRSQVWNPSHHHPTLLCLGNTPK